METNYSNTDTRRFELLTRLWKVPKIFVANEDGCQVKQRCAVWAFLKTEGLEKKD